MSGLHRQDQFVAPNDLQIYLARPMMADVETARPHQLDGMGVRWRVDERTDTGGRYRTTFAKGILEQGRGRTAVQVGAFAGSPWPV
jgi:hypothetical protein